jgi:hypothetical protein
MHAVSDLSINVSKKVVVQGDPSDPRSSPIQCVVGGGAT